MMGRALLVSALALLHFAVALLLLRVSAEAARPVVVPTIIMVAIPEPQITAESAAPAIAIESVAHFEAPLFEIDPISQTIAAGPCGLTDDVQIALQQDQSVGIAISQIPATARSVSNALLVWDGRWAMPGSIGGDAALRPIQSLVQARIRAAPAACQEEAITGPRLMVVSQDSGVVVLAFGSGVWRWDQLL
jgi:hypothetical protein